MKNRAEFSVLQKRNNESFDRNIEGAFRRRGVNIDMHGCILQRNSVNKCLILICIVEGIKIFRWNSVDESSDQCNQLLHNGTARVAVIGRENGPFGIIIRRRLRQIIVTN